MALKTSIILLFFSFILALPSAICGGNGDVANLRVEFERKFTGGRGNGDGKKVSAPSGANGRKAMQNRWKNANTGAAAAPKPREHLTASLSGNEIAQISPWNCEKFQKGQERCEKWLEILDAMKTNTAEKRYFMVRKDKEGNAICQQSPLGLGVLKRQLQQANSVLQQPYNHDGLMLPVPPLSAAECKVKSKETWTSMLAEVEEQLRDNLPVSAEKIPLAYMDKARSGLTLKAFREVVQQALDNIENSLEPPALPKKEKLHAKSSEQEWLQVYDKLNEKSEAIKRGQFTDLKYKYVGQQVDNQKLFALAQNIVENVIAQGKQILIKPPTPPTIKDRIANWNKFNAKNN